MMNSLLFLTHIKESKAMSCTKAVLRTIFYQYFLLIVGLTVGFIINAEYVGWKSPLIVRSFNNIFFPVQMDEELCQKIKNFGATRIWATLEMPSGFKVIEDGLMAEEFYIAKVEYQNENGKTVTEILDTRIRWKPWEYYYNDSPEKWSEEDFRKYTQEGTLNSQETDKGFKLIRERKEIERKKLKI
jgi:hypothetical protein